MSSVSSKIALSKQSSTRFLKIFGAPGPGFFSFTNSAEKTKDREEKSIHHHRGDPPFFLFPCLRLYGVYPSFRTYGVYPFPLFSQESGIHHRFFCSVTSGSGDRPRKEGSHGGGVYSFFPLKDIAYKHPVLTLYGYGKILTEGISLIF